MYVDRAVPARYDATYARPSAAARAVRARVVAPARAREGRGHTLIKRPRILCILESGGPHANYRLGILQKARRGAGLGVMLAEQGGASVPGSEGDGGSQPPRPRSGAARNPPPF